MTYVTFCLPCPGILTYVDPFYPVNGPMELIDQASYPGQLLALSVEYLFYGMSPERIVDAMSADFDDLAEIEFENLSTVMTTVWELCEPYIDVYYMSVYNTINNLIRQGMPYRSILRLLDPNTLELSIEIG